jgi:hypothetical protein
MFSGLMLVRFIVFPYTPTIDGFIELSLMLLQYFFLLSYTYIVD